MSKIKLTLPGLEIPVDGKQVSFVAPCDCSVADGIQIDGVDYDIVDSVGNTVPFGRGVWRNGAVLSVILDVTNRKAYLQNQNSFTKAETMTTATAERFGLGVDAVPNDVFAFLGKYNLHWWRMRGYGSHYEAFVQSDEEQLTWSVPSSSGAYFYYSDAITVSQTDGKISLVNPQRAHNKWGQGDYSYVVGRYVAREEYENLDSVYKFDTDVTYTSSGVDSTLRTVFKGGVQTIIGIYVEKTTDWQLVFSHDANAYPKSGVVDGFEYQYFGVPFEKFPTMPQIATGNYVGTGMYGQNNPNSLSFDFIPLLIGISIDYHASNQTASAIFTCPDIGGKYNSGGGARGIAVVSTSVVKIYPYASADGKTVYWVSPDSTQHQFNDNGIVYNYFAIG